MNRSAGDASVVTEGNVCPSSCCADQEGTEGLGGQRGVTHRLVEEHSGNPGCFFAVGQWGNPCTPRGKASSCSLLFAALGGLPE